MATNLSLEALEARSAGPAHVYCMHVYIHTWLVVDLPLWKIWVRQLGWWNSQYMERHKIHVPNQTTKQIHLCVCMCMYKQWCLIVWLVLDGNHPIFLHQLGVLGVLSAGFMWLLLGHLYHLALVACSKTTHLSSSPSGWWYTYPSEKYESQWEGWHPTYYGT